MRKKAAIGVLVALHTLLLAAYTFPEPLVPIRLRFWAQAYARVLFHQDWRLFAPDPPACGCDLEYRTEPEGEWRELQDHHRHFVWRRMTANACRYCEARVDYGWLTHASAPRPLARSLRAMINDPERDAVFQIHRKCSQKDLFIPVILTEQ